MSIRPGACPGWLAPIGAVLVALCAASLHDTAASGERDAQTTLTAVLRRAGAYVSVYKRQLGSVIADEYYVQRINEPDPSKFTSRAVAGTNSTILSWTRQEMTSELLLFIQPGDDQPWIAFRDVFEVDSTPVEDRQERLVDLFRRTPEVDAALWERLVAESARFNIGKVYGNVNVPTTALQLLTWADQNRVRFEKDGEDRIDGVDTWRIDFEEFAPPALIIGEGGVPIYATGRLWIEPGTGRVLRTEIETDDPTIELRTEATVHCEPDPRLGLLVPARMSERYRYVEFYYPQERWGRSRTARQHDGEIFCEATYSNFRRFETEVSFTVPDVGSH
ncbi:MAG: hypothetical protein CL471_10020 [Acidobacteria bacterium]|nr:hypothetical protein [Acidobacteriota bacterium]